MCVCMCEVDQTGLFVRKAPERQLLTKQEKEERRGERGESFDLTFVHNIRRSYNIYAGVKNTET